MFAPDISYITLFWVRSPLKIVSISRPGHICDKTDVVGCFRAPDSFAINVINKLLKPNTSSCIQSSYLIFARRRGIVMQIRHSEYEESVNHLA